MILELVSAANLNGFLLKTSAMPCGTNCYRKSNSLVQLIFEKISELLFSNATVRWQERLGQSKERPFIQNVSLSSTLVLVQRTALSILTRHWTD